MGEHPHIYYAVPLMTSPPPLGQGGFDGCVMAISKPFCFSHQFWRKTTVSQNGGGFVRKNGKREKREKKNNGT